MISDCDGVLVGSERLIVAVEAQICRERGWALTEDDIVREFVGLSGSAIPAERLAGEGVTVFDDMAALPALLTAS